MEQSFVRQLNYFWKLCCLHAVDIFLDRASFLVCHYHKFILWRSSSLHSSNEIFHGVRFTLYHPYQGNVRWCNGGFLSFSFGQLNRYINPHEEHTNSSPLILVLYCMVRSLPIFFVDKVGIYRETMGFMVFRSETTTDGLMAFCCGPQWSPWGTWVADHFEWSHVFLH